MGSYFHVVYSHLIEADNFLEIGYRKGLFVEVARALVVTSTHVDIDDALLRAKSDKKNTCHTSDSISFLKKCEESFDLIFQDGAKDYKTRKKEYDLIMKRGILRKGGIILVDDLHYAGCQKAFDYASKKYGFETREAKVMDKKPYSIGILTWTK